MIRPDTRTEATLVSGTPKRKAPADIARDLRRAARRNAEQQATVRADRVDAGARSETVNEFMAGSLNRRQRELDAQKLGLRVEVRNGLGVTENESYVGPVSLRGARS